ncbi:MAG: hypothetical protein H6631_09370 [Anaerolineaceae bacterium]|nr:hypothetical protein [Anaerolineaceae bacterium]
MPIAIIIFRLWPRAGLIGLLTLLLLLETKPTVSPTFAAALIPTTWYVNAATGSDSNDCLTTGTACQTVSEAVSKAAGGDTIQIAAGVYQENLDIMQSLTLIGAGPTSTFLDGDNTQRVVVAQNSVVISNLTIQHGHITNANGGGVFNVSTLTLQNVRVVDNTAVNGGGGGIYNIGDLTLIDSEVSGNDSDNAGGGLYTWTTSATTITTSLIDDNDSHQGGGLFNLGTLNMTDSTVSDNHATGYSGGGLIIMGGSVTLNRDTFSGNQTVSNGGGISNQLGTLDMTNVTISNNQAGQFGGLSNDGASAVTTILNSTIAYNTATGSGTHFGGVGGSAGAISFQNSIVAHNDNRNCLVGSGWSSNGHNLSSDPHCAFTGSGDLTNTPADLAPLASYNGSPTEMHGLLPGSAAIDGGDNSACPAIDQRGAARPFNGDGSGAAECDIGAFEALAQLTVNDVTVSEGNSGTTSAAFTVALSPAAGQTVTVDYATANGSATANGDYTAQSGTLTFTPGQVEKTVTIAVKGDGNDEPDENFTLNLSNAANADIIDGQGVGTIIDDDGLSSLTVADVSVNELDSSGTIAQFTVSLSPPAASTVMVDAVTSNGTATAGSDYTAVNQTLTFAPGHTTKQVEVFIAGDTVDEGVSENFQLNLTNAVNANITDGTAVGTIIDNDTARVGVQPGPTLHEGISGSTSAQFSVTLDKPAAFPVTVDYTTQNGSGSGSATAGIDYEAASGTLTFSSGQTSKTVSVTIYGDTITEPDEHFDLFLSNANPVPLYANTSTATILNGTENSRVYLPLISKP